MNKLTEKEIALIEMLEEKWRSCHHKFTRIEIDTFKLKFRCDYCGLILYGKLPKVTKEK